MSQNTTTDLLFAACIFTFKNDADGAFEAIRALQREIPSIPVLIAEDGNNPLTEAQKQRFLDAWGDEIITIQTTTYPRNGNLQGKECAIGQLTVMRDFLKERGANWGFKFDSDTCLQDSDVFASRIEAKTRAVFPHNLKIIEHYGNSVMKAKHPEGWGAGIMYALRTDSIDAIIEHIAAKDKCYGEDYEISTTVRALWPDDGMAWIEWENGNFVGFHFVELHQASKRAFIVPVPTAVRMAGYKIAYFGNRHELPDSYTDEQRRQTSAVYMRALNDYKALEAAKNTEE